MSSIHSLPKTKTSANLHSFMSPLEPPSIFFLLPLLLLLLLLSTSSKAQPKPTQTFTYINQGEFGPYITENHATYRPLPIATSPFQFCFYNTTPNSFYLALRMGTSRSESTRRWVWQANPSRPVRENSTFALRSDGNLLLSDSDGRTVWSTGTSNRGVVGLKILPNGNAVLYDIHDRLVWQSFDHPVDTLLVGQTLKNKLVSKNAAYTLAMEPTGLSMYINSVSSSRTPLKYGAFVESQKLSSLKFECEPENEGKFAYELRLALGVNTGTEILARPKYNATLSFLRLEEDGNLVVYTYYDPVDYRAWERTFAFFSDDLGRVDGCDLPGKCGALGVCKDEMCVACPTRRGLLGWSENCATRAITRKCKGGRSLEYYKVEGVENFLSGYGEGEGEGRLKMEECKRRCDLDCECVGFLYWEKESRCWLAPWIGTLKSVSDASHVAYIKYAN